MKQLEADIIRQHRNEDIRTVLDAVAGISKYIYVTSKEIELKYEREEISNYLTEKRIDKRSRRTCKIYYTKWWWRLLITIYSKK